MRRHPSHPQDVAIGHKVLKQALFSAETYIYQCSLARYELTGMLSLPLFPAGRNRSDYCKERSRTDSTDIRNMESALPGLCWLLLGNVTVQTTERSKYSKLHHLHRSLYRYMKLCLVNMPRLSRAPRFLPYMYMTILHFPSVIHLPNIGCHKQSRGVEHRERLPIPQRFQAGTGFDLFSPNIRHVTRQIAAKDGDKDHRS